MRTYKTEGIVLKRSNYGEADRILTVFTKHYGKIKILAKGVRRIKSRRGPNIELFNWAVLFVTKGRNLDLLSEAEVKNSFSPLKDNLKKIGLCYQLCELIDGLCPEKQEQRRVFDLLTETLKTLDNPDHGLSMALLTTFELRLLQELGYWPKDRTPPSDLEFFIEGILERKLKTPRFLAQIQAAL